MKLSHFSLTLLCLAATASGCRAQDADAVAETKAAKPAAKVTEAPAPLKIIPPQVTGLKHPFLLVGGAEISGLKQKFNDPKYADLKKIILQEADLLMTYNGESKEPKQLTPAQRAWKLGGQKKQPVLNILPWAYVFSGKPEYKEMFLDVMKYDFERMNKGALIFDPTKFSSEFTMVQFAVHGAFAYDLLYPELTEEQRRDFGKYLDQALDLYRNRVKASYGWSNNIGCIYFASSAIVAMARLEENPMAPAILEECLTKIKEVYYKASVLPHPDGGYPEGALYRNFALLWNLTLIECYERTLGKKDHGLLDAPFFENSQRYMETIMGGDGIWMTFNDVQPQWYGAPSAAWLGARYDQPLMRWMSDYLVKQFSEEDPETRSRGLQPTYWVMTFLYRDNKPSPANMPALPTVATLPSLNTGTLRSEGTLTPALQVAVKGRGPEDVGHGQPDSGSIVLYARGENLLLDPGYFLAEPAQHSLPVVDAQGPMGRKGTPLTALQKGGLRSMVVDATPDYQPGPGKGPARVQRSVIMQGNSAVVVLDDIVPGKAGAGQVENHLQTSFATTVNGDGRGAVVQGKKGPLQVRAFGPEAKLTVTGPLDFGKSWIFKRLADEGKIAWHRLTATYTASPTRPLVWVMTPGNASGVKVDYQEKSINVTVPGSGQIVFTYDAARGWTPAEGAA